METSVRPIMAALAAIFVTYRWKCTRARRGRSNKNRI